MKNIGNSILPSSSPEVLAPLSFGSGVLQVEPNEAKDTHELFLIKGAERLLLASHPNGHSLRALAERMASGSGMRTQEQAEYICRCGGNTLPMPELFGLMRPSPKLKTYERNHPRRSVSIRH